MNLKKYTSLTISYEKHIESIEKDIQDYSQQFWISKASHHNDFFLDNSICSWAYRWELPEGCYLHRFPQSLQKVRSCVAS